MTLLLKARVLRFAAVAGVAAAVVLMPNPGVRAEDMSKLTVEQRLDRLESESVIRWKLQDYMRLLDAADWDNYIELFAPDGKIDIVEGVLQGRDAIKTRMANATARMAKAREGQPKRQSAHILSNIKVVMTGQETAAAQSRFTMLGENADGTFTVTGSGFYTDQWVRQNGEWMIGYRAVHWDLLHNQSGDAGAKETAATRDIEVKAMASKLTP
jgi:3-phenylpropionate/cinnamic acid dioxygenase small subunit